MPRTSTAVMSLLVVAVAVAIPSVLAANDPQWAQVGSIVALLALGAAFGLAARHVWREAPRTRWPLAVALLLVAGGLAIEYVVRPDVEKPCTAADVCVDETTLVGLALAWGAVALFGAGLALFGRALAPLLRTRPRAARGIIASVGLALLLSAVPAALAQTAGDPWGALPTCAAMGALPKSASCQAPGIMASSALALAAGLLALAAALVPSRVLARIAGVLAALGLAVGTLIAGRGAGATVDPYLVLAGLVAGAALWTAARGVRAPTRGVEVIARRPA